MRRLGALLALIAAGLLIGFIVRLVWPRRSLPVYVPPTVDTGSDR